MRCILFISLHVRKVLCWGYVIEWCLLIMVSFIHKSLCWEDTTPRWSDLYEIKINGAIFYISIIQEVRVTILLSDLEIVLDQRSPCCNIQVYYTAVNAHRHVAL